jgi:hypothetical protein
MEGAQGLQEVVSKRSVPDVVITRKELLFSLGKFKAVLTNVIRGNSMKANLQKAWQKKGKRAYQEALDLADS